MTKIDQSIGTAVLRPWRQAIKPHVRAAIAAIALSHASGRKITTVFSRAEGVYIDFDAEVVGDRVDGFDYSNGCHIKGVLPELLHHGAGTRLVFSAKPGGKYEGRDYGTQTNFEISVIGSSANVLDLGIRHSFLYTAIALQKPVWKF